MPKRNIVWIAAVLAAAVIVWFTRTPRPVSDPDAKDFAPVIRTYRHIRDAYYRPVAPDELRAAAVRGMVESLDEFSRYIPPGEAEAVGRRMMGRLDGLGLSVGVEDGRLRILGTLAGSPAQRAGISAADRIIAIDGREAIAAGADEANEMLAGPLGSDVELRLEDSDGAVRTVRLSRTAFEVRSVAGICRDALGRNVWRLDADERISYVRIKEFVPPTQQDFQRALREMGRTEALVLDLRDNPGGLLAAAVGVADMLLGDGVIVTVQRRGEPPQTYAASAGSACPADLPVVVLINDRTASAAEIVAGALRQAGRAVLIGTRTAGKGCLQKVHPLPGGLGRVSLSVGEYVLSGGKRINRVGGAGDWGVDPHLRLTLSSQARRTLGDLRARSELVGRAPVGLSETGAAEWLARRRDELLAADPQLREAAALAGLPQVVDDILAATRRRASARASAADDLAPPDDE